MIASMNDTAQLDASTASVPSQGDTGAPPAATESAPPNMGTGAAPALPANATGSGADANTATPPADASNGAAPADKGEAPPASLTNPKSVVSTAQDPAKQQQADPAMLERQEAGRWGRERQRMVQELERQRGELTKLQQYREEAERKAQQANLKRWDSQHPEQRKFDGLLARRAEARRQLAEAKRLLPEGLPPEYVAKWQQAQEQLIASGFSEQEQAELGEFDNFQAEQVRGLTTNMPATIGKIVMPMIRQEFKSMMQELHMQRDVTRDLEDPELKPLIAKYGDDMARAMEEGVPYEQAIHYTKVYGQYEAALAEIARLKQQMDGMNGKVQAASVQQELAKGKASITRDVVAPKTNPFLEARKWARENGVDTDSDAFRKKIREIEQRPG